MVSYHTIQSFDHPSTLNMFMSMKSCQTQIHIHIDSQLTNDNSNEEALETLSNLLLAFGQKTFPKSSRIENTQDAISSY